MAAQGGGTVYLDAQTYHLTDTLKLPSRVNIVGKGAGSVIAWHDSIRQTVDKPLLYADDADDVRLSDFKLSCSIDQTPDSGETRTQHMGLFFNCLGDPTKGEVPACDNIALDRLEVAYCSMGVHLKGLKNLTATDLDLHDNGNLDPDLYHNLYLLRVVDFTVAQTSLSSGGLYNSPRGHGFRGSKLFNGVLDHLSIHDNADHGVHIDTVYGLTLKVVQIQGNCARPTGNCSQFMCWGGQCDVRVEP